MSCPDIALDYWADQFVQAGLAKRMTFEDFMQRSMALRERLLFRLGQPDLQERIERKFPDASLRGNALIDPFHHGPRRFRQSWFRNNRNLV